MRRWWALSVCAVMVCAAPLTGRAEDKKPEAAKSTATSWGHIEVKGAYPEHAAMPGLFGELSESLAELLDRLDQASKDDTLQGLVLYLHEPQISWGKLHEVRTAIARVRAAGKKVYAYTEAGSNADYQIGSACDEVWIPESAVLMTTGIRAEVSFYKNLFDKLDIHAEMLRVGEYKSAAEPYNRTEMSPEFREELETILDSFYTQMLKNVAESRKLTPEQVAAAIDQSPLTAAKAKDLGLIDHIGYYDELEAVLKGTEKTKNKIVKKYGKKKVDTDFSGLTGMMKMMDLLMGVETPKRKSTAAKIAVIYASGPIMPGNSTSDPFTGESTIGSDTLVKAIRQASEDDTVKTIVMRVDSPGGSALASDLIWHEIEQVKKPFVVSMSDVAGSGGYYIAMNADKIFAEPGTITGSIGVVGGKIALQGLFDKVGINTSIISRGKNSGVLSTTTPFNESERAAFQSLLNDIYRIFTTKAATGRKMEYEKLEKLARGRIYTGLQAKELGLIDEVGTIDDAIASARELAGIKPDEKLERLVLPKASSPLEALFGPLDLGTAMQQAQARNMQILLDGALPGVGEHLGQLGALTQLAKEPRLVLMPYRILVK